MKILRGLLVALLLLPAAAHAQSSAAVVATCGTLGQAYTAGATRPITQSTAGELCTNAAGGGGGGAVTMASGAVASGAYSSGSIASGAVASGAIASGAMVDLGAQADAACATDNGTCTLIALQKRNNQRITTLDTTLQTPIAGVSQAQFSAAASSIVAKASAGSVVSISGSAVSGSYIMLFNATSAPADGAVTPVKCWGPMSAAGPFSFGWGPGPVFTMSTGITVVSSSTGCFTKTATNAAFISVEYQ